MDWIACSQPYTDPTTSKISFVPKLDCVGPLLQVIIGWAFYFVGSVAVVLILYAAVRLILSRGDSKQVQEARQILTYALIGLIVVLTSIAIFYILTNLVGIKCVQSFGFNSCPAPTP